MVMRLLKMTIKAVFPDEIINKARDWINRYSRKAYSQEGEDLILERLFEYKDNGFYVDIGAHHPFRFSNTYIFYRKGWRGINVDAMPGSMQSFNRYRPKDINLEIGVGAQPQELTYYAFNEPALNTFDRDLAYSRHGKRNYYITNEIRVPVYPLSEVLDAHLPDGQEIDFLSIDVEGLDFQVLEGNNWGKYRPKVILLEILSSSIEDIVQSPVFQFLKEKHYILFAKTFNTCLFLDVEFFREVYR